MSALFAYSLALSAGVSFVFQQAVNSNLRMDIGMKDLVAEHFSDVSRVSSVFMQEVTGGFMDEGPPLSAYAAVLLDEEGELHLLEPVIP